MPKIERLGGIVLCGGRSSRLGISKALLPIGSETLLERVVRLLGEVVAKVVVVAAPGQALPPLPIEVIHVADRETGRGPLEGLRTGLAALAGTCDTAYLTGCDAPLLVPEFVGRLYELLGPASIALPEVDGSRHPLSAIYRTTIVDIIDELLLCGAGPLALSRRLPTRIVTADELCGVDPELATLIDIDERADYEAVLARLGLPMPAGLFDQGAGWTL
jgi:molybdopterin-guanine dinucleotide biosynthesis protein A